MAQKVFTSEMLTSSDVNTYLAGEGGAWTSWTPAVVQSGSVTVTNTRSRYARYGRTIVATFNLAVTGSGTGGNAITVSLPVTAAASGNVPCGSVVLNDSSSGIIYSAHAVLSTTSVIQLWTTSTDGTGVSLGVSVFTAALASSDGISGTITYEAAS